MHILRVLGSGHDCGHIQYYIHIERGYRQVLVVSKIITFNSY